MSLSPMLAQLRKKWSDAAFSQWERATIARAAAMAKEGAQEARITISGVIKKAVVEEALRRAQFVFTPFEGDYIISWAAAEVAQSKVLTIGFENLAAHLRSLSNGKPLISRVEAAERIALVEALREAEYHASILSDSLPYHLRDRDVDPDRFATALEAAGITVDRGHAPGVTSKATGVLAYFWLSGWANEQ